MGTSESFTVCLPFASTNQALDLVLERWHSVSSKAGLSRHGHLHDHNSRRYVQWCDESTQSREHKPQSNPVTIAAPTLPLLHPGTWAETCTSPPRADRTTYGVCLGSSLHGLHWKCRPGATSPGARSNRVTLQGDGTTSLPGSLPRDARSYLPSTHTNPIVFLSNNRKTELGLGGDQI